MCVHIFVLRIDTMEINYETIIFFTFCHFWRKDNFI